MRATLTVVVDSCSCLSEHSSKHALKTNLTNNLISSSWRGSEARRQRKLTKLTSERSGSWGWRKPVTKIMHTQAATRTNSTSLFWSRTWIKTDKALLSRGSDNRAEHKRTENVRNEERKSTQILCKYRFIDESLNQAMQNKEERWKIS